MTLRDGVESHTVRPDTRGFWYADADTDLQDFSGRVPPKKLMFSLNGKCNLRCDHCARGVYDLLAQQSPVQLIDYVMEHLLPHVRCVRLGGTDQGEQLTSPHFNRFLRRVHELGSIHLEVISNLTLMDEERAELIALACNEFVFSLEGIGAAFERVRHFPWNKVERHLEMLVAARRRLAGGSKLKIFSLVTCFYDNLDDLLAILDLVDKGVDRVQYRLFNPVTGEQTSQSLLHHAAAANRVFDQIRGEAARRGIHVQLPPNLDETRTALVEVIPLNATTWRSKSGSVGVSVPRETGHSRRSSRRTWNRRLMAIGRAVPGARSIVGRWRRFRRCASTGTARDDSEAGKTLLETIEVKTGLSAKSDEPELRCDEESISAGSGAELRPQRANSASWVCHFPFETVSVLSNGELGTCCEGIRLGQLNLERPNLDEAWTGPDWRHLRKSLAVGRWSGLCATCDFRRDRMRELGLDPAISG